PFFRRPDLLQSMVTYAQHHPSLSYFFSGLFVGPTSQAPRPDETRHEKLYELEIAFSLLNKIKEERDYAALDRLLRNLLTDSDGNTHKAEICIDKLYARESPSGRQGIVELRSFEMMPHAHMCLLEMLLVRALVSMHWQIPYKKRLIRWGTLLHDKFMLPYFLWNDFCEVLKDLKSVGYDFKEEWYLPFLQFRFPSYGKTRIENMDIELSMALEPWHALHEDGAHRQSRTVDNSTERVQILVKNLTPSRYIITCNERRIPLHRTDVESHYIAGIRFKARNLKLALHPSLPLNTPLVFDVYDTWHMRSIGGFSYYSEHPGGTTYEQSPINAMEAESRVISRFVKHGYNPHMEYPKTEEINGEYPYTLDLRRTNF
ncbi:MAG TPA: transglutaminase family protein, partial [Myxococcota bacterium]|nr:transglutaminase family protein [Myxococcota bacterium]